MRLRLQDPQLSTASGFAAIVLWSTTFALARGVSEQAGPITAGTMVYLIGGMLCLLRLWWLRVPWDYFRTLPRSYLLGCGSLFIFYTAAIYLAVGLAQDREQVLEIALINYLWPAATVLLSLPLLHKKANPLLLVGTALALAGVFLVMTPDASVSWTAFYQHLANNPAAYGLALSAALSWALYSNLTRRWSVPGGGGAVELFVPATGCVLLLMRLLTPEPRTWGFPTLVEASVLGAITAVAYAFWDAAMRKGNLLLVVAGSYFTPLLSTLVSAIYLKVLPGPGLWMGCLLLITGSLITWRSVSETKG